MTGSRTFACGLKNLKWCRLVPLLVVCAVALVSCRKEQPSDVPDDAIATTAPSTPDVYIPEMVDQEDDPAAPRTLPRSNDVQGWIKTVPIRMAGGHQIPVVMADQDMDMLLSGYRIERVSVCEYTSANATVKAYMVDTRTVDDAFGIFSIHEKRPGCAAQGDNSFRGAYRDGNRLDMHAWQGKSWFRMDCTLRDIEAGTKDAERLLDRVVFLMQAEEPPLLLRAVQEFKMERCDLWVVRMADKLTRVNQPTLQRLNPGLVDERLELSSDTLLSIVAIQQEKGTLPVLIWMAEYPTAEAAKAAAETYGRALHNPSTELDAQTLIGPVKGRMVIGTWNADQESARELVKLLGQALPD